MSSQMLQSFSVQDFSLGKGQVPRKCLFLILFSVFVIKNTGGVIFWFLFIYFFLQISSQTSDWPFPKRHK